MIRSGGRREQEHCSLREQDYIMQNASSSLAIFGGHQRLIKTILISSARDEHTGNKSNKSS